jgi:hypothetical protein
VIGFCVFLCLLVHYAGWLIVEDLVDDKDVSGGYFAVLGAIRKYWAGLLKFFIISTLTILFHTVVFDRPSLSRGKWRFVLTPVVYPVVVLVAFMLLRTIFLYDPDFRTWSGHAEALDPVRVYLVTLVTAYFLIIVVGSLLRLALAILEIVGLKNG